MSIPGRGGEVLGFAVVFFSLCVRDGLRTLFRDAGRAGWLRGPLITERRERGPLILVLSCADGNVDLLDPAAAAAFDPPPFTFSGDGVRGPASLGVERAECSSVSVVLRASPPVTESLEPVRACFLFRDEVQGETGALTSNEPTNFNGSPSECAGLTASDRLPCRWGKIEEMLETAEEGSDTDELEAPEVLMYSCSGSSSGIGETPLRP